MELTLESVADIHHSGGTILASSRGGFDCDRIISFLLDNRINQLYVIGGDGTHRGANKIAEDCLARQLNIAVVGIPKTIDNDVDLIDRSFGEHTMMLYYTKNNHHVHLYTHRHHHHHFLPLLHGQHSMPITYNTESHLHSLELIGSYTMDLHT